jgi:phosphatidate phosphatase APP1
MQNRPKSWLLAVLFLERGVDRLTQAVRSKTGMHRRLIIVSYHGLGNRNVLVARGRVLAVRSMKSAEAGHSPWKNLRSNLTRFLSREIPYAGVLARHGNVEARVTADQEGYFEARLEFPEGLPAGPDRFHVELRLESPPTREPVLAIAEITVPHSDVPFGIISDIDDTILHTGSLRLWEAAKVTLFRNAHTRLPLPGVAALFKGLHGKDGAPHRPFFCVSSSPWNLHDLLTEFFSLRGFPGKPVLFLRDWGLSPEGLLPSSHRSHKLKALRHILDTTSPLPFILFGDSAQEDPEVYREIVEAYPGRVLAAYIRNVNTDLKRPEAIRKLAIEVLEKGSTLILAQDSLAIAEHALAKGWIEASDVAAVRGEVRREGKPESETTPLAQAEKVSGSLPEAKAEVREGGIEKALDEGKAGAPATVWVE